MPEFETFEEVGEYLSEMANRMDALEWHGFDCWVEFEHGGLTLYIRKRKREE